MGAKLKGSDEFKRAMRKAIDNAIPDAKKVVGRGALNVKRGAQRIIKADSHYGYLPHYPRSISYEVIGLSTSVRARIGPLAEKLQGGLGSLLENGSVNNAPIPHLAPALELEVPEFLSYMEKLGQQLLEGLPVEGTVVDPGD
jgi:hypothetical protein